jgi:hypothetical protein
MNRQTLNWLTQTKDRKNIKSARKGQKRDNSRCRPQRGGMRR